MLKSLGVILSKQVLWIFGDSYAEDNTKAKIRNSKHWDGVWNWPEEVTRIFDVENMGISGCGPQTQFKYFKQMIDDRELEFCKDVNVLFFISNPYRFEFNFYETPFHQTYPIRFYGNKKDINLEAVWDYGKYDKFIKQYFNHVTIDPVQETEKYVSYLKTHSKFFNKMLVFNCFYSISSELAESLNDDKFCLINTPLTKVNTDPKHKWAVNHLSNKNHKIMYSMITGYFLKDQPVKFERFVDVDIK